MISENSLPCLGYRLGTIGVRVSTGVGIFLISTAFRPAQCPTELSVHWVPRPFTIPWGWGWPSPRSARIMLPPHIAEHSPRDLESGCVDSVLALARPRVGMCTQCARPRATNVRHSGRVWATVCLMSVFLFRIKGRSCPNKRKHERSDYTSRAAQSLVSEQSEQFSCSEVTS
jgi:hypothetical protein